MKKIVKKPILILLCAVIALSACLAGCTTNEPGFAVPLSDTTRSALELCTTPHKDSELNQIYRFMLDDNINGKKLNEKYEIQCLRKNDDGYTVIYNGNTRVLVLHFDSNGKWQQADKLHCLYRVIDTRGKFDALKTGDPVTKVQTADPTCYFPFLVDHESTDLKTDHYTEDGYHTTILYDENHQITSVTHEII